MAPRDNGGRGKGSPTTTDLPPKVSKSICNDCEKVVAVMRSRADRNWRSTGGGVKNLHARHVESGVDACLQVVANMAARWMGDEKMEFYFRPSTLFRPGHFDEYLNARRATPAEEKDTTTSRQQRFKIRCSNCGLVWTRSVMVSKNQQFESLDYHQKAAAEAFANAVTGQGQECGCMSVVTVCPDRS